MRPSFLLPLLLPAAALAQGFTGDPGGIIGDWTCETADVGGSAVYDVRFTSDGRIDGEARLSFETPDGPVHVEFVYEGSWRPGSGSFFETARSFTYITLELGGDRLPWASLPPEFTAQLEAASGALVGVEIENRIVELTDSALTYRDTSSGTTAVCRAGLG